MFALARWEGRQSTLCPSSGVSLSSSFPPFCPDVFLASLPLSLKGHLPQGIVRPALFAMPRNGSSCHRQRLSSARAPCLKTSHLNAPRHQPLRCWLRVGTFRAGDCARRADTHHCKSARAGRGDHAAREGTTPGTTYTASGARRARPESTAPAARRRMRRSRGRGGVPRCAIRSGACQSDAGAPSSATA